MMTKKLALTAVAALFSTTPALAQVNAAQVRPGMQVYYGNNQAVGVVTKVSGDVATISTGNHAVPLSANSFALEKGNLYISMTRDALDNYYVTKVLPAETSLDVGKPVVGLEGTTLGTIKEIDDEKVVITLTGGQPIQLPRSGIVGGATGAKVGISAADVAKQLGTTGTPATKSASTTASATGNDAK